MWEFQFNVDSSTSIITGFLDFCENLCSTFDCKRFFKLCHLLHMKRPYCHYKYFMVYFNAGFVDLVKYHTMFVCLYPVSSLQRLDSYMPQGKRSRHYNDRRTDGKTRSKQYTPPPPPPPPPPKKNTLHGGGGKNWTETPQVQHMVKNSQKSYRV